MQLQLFATTEPESEVTRLHAARSKLTHALLSQNTISGYRYDWAMFNKWCSSMQRRALPATTETVSLYLTWLLEQGKKITTARRRNCAIAHEHRARGLLNPITTDIQELLSGAQRLRQEKPRQMKPLSLEQLRRISNALLEEGTAAALRNRALMVFGFATALRRSSLAELQIGDVEFGDHGLVVSVRREKQDQEGRGRLIGVPPGKHPLTCPVRTLQGWLKVRGALPGPLFWRLNPGDLGKPLNGDAVCRIVKKCVARIGLDPSNYGGHSLRAGFITEAGEAGVGEFVIASQTGHRSMDVLRRYFRRQSLWKANACSALEM